MNDIPHPIATYELDEEQLLAATITEVAEARVHLNDAETALQRRFGSEAKFHIERARTCLQAALSRVHLKEIPLPTGTAHAIDILLDRAVMACDIPLPHIALLIATRTNDKRMFSHAEHATTDARKAVHAALAALLDAKAAA